jgi:hypothetical protein
MSYRQWIYHETEQPKIIDSDDLASYVEDGWADSPAQFLKLESVGLDKDKIAAGDEEEAAKAQQALDAVEGVVASLNGALNLEKMKKAELEAYALEHFGVDLDKRRTKKALIKQINELMES